MALDPQVQSLLAMMPAERGLSAETLADSRAQFGMLMQLGLGAVPEAVQMHEASADGVPVRVYTPDGGASPKPIVVFIHGGGWTIGSASDYDPLTRVLAVETDAIVVSVDYRLAPEHPYPAAVDDCWAALDWCVAHAGELGADASRIAVAGDSAGGNLSAVLAQRAAERGGPKLALQALIYPVVDCDLERASYVENAKGYFLERDSMHFFFDSYCESAGQRADANVSPLRAANLEQLARQGLAPAVVITAEFDPLRDEGEAYAEALRAAGATVEATRYDGMIHGFVAMPGLIDGGRRGL
ncbi:MAG TPA: alpha/beta hydrolase, partial [Acidimicrobiia bacterium]